MTGNVLKSHKPQQQQQRQQQQQQQQQQLRQIHEENCYCADIRSWMDKRPIHFRFQLKVVDKTLTTFLLTFFPMIY